MIEVATTDVFWGRRFDNLFLMDVFIADGSELSFKDDSHIEQSQGMWRIDLNPC